MDPERLRKLLTLEIDRVTDDMRRRRGFLIAVWGRHRARAPFLDLCFSRWRTLSFADLAQLSSDEVAALDAFFRELDELRLYLGHTEDMPRALTTRYDNALAALDRLALEALLAMGQPPPAGLNPPVPTGWWSRGEE